MTLPIESAKPQNPSKRKGKTPSLLGRTSSTGITDKACNWALNILNPGCCVLFMAIRFFESTTNESTFSTEEKGVSTHFSVYGGFSPIRNSD